MIGHRTELDEWLATRPARVREVLDRYPIGSEIVSEDGAKYFVLGAHDEGHLILAPIAFRDDYERAAAERFYVCAHCIDAGRVHRVQ